MKKKNKSKKKKLIKRLDKCKLCGIGVAPMNKLTHPNNIACKLKQAEIKRKSPTSTKVSETLVNCSVCGVELKRKNYSKHFKKAHRNSKIKMSGKVTIRGRKLIGLSKCDLCNKEVDNAMAYTVYNEIKKYCYFCAKKHRKLHKEKYKQPLNYDAMAPGRYVSMGGGPGTGKKR